MAENRDELSLPFTAVRIRKLLFAVEDLRILGGPEKEKKGKKKVSDVKELASAKQSFHKANSL